MGRIFISPGNPFRRTVNRRKSIDSEDLNIKKFLKEVTGDLIKIENRIKRGEDNAAFFMLNTIVTSLMKNPEALSSYLDSIDPDLLNGATHGYGIHNIKKQIDAFPALLYSLERKKALILFNTFGLDRLLDTSQSRNISTALDYLNVRDQQRRETIIKMAFEISDEMKLKEAGYRVLARKVDERMFTFGQGKTSFFMAVEYSDLLKRAGLDEEQIEEVANMHENKTLDVWVRNIRRSLGFEKPKAETSRNIIEARIDLTGSPQNGTNSPSPSIKNLTSTNGTTVTQENNLAKTNNGTKNNDSEPPALEDKPIVEKPLITEEAQFPAITISTDKLSSPQILTKEESLIFNEYCTKKPIPDYNKFLENILFKLKGIGTFLTIKELQDILLNTFGLTTANYFDREGIEDSTKVKFADAPNGTKLKVTNLNCPLLDEIGVEYGPIKGLPSYHQLAIKYTDIGDPEKKKRLHTDFHNYNMKKIIGVKITYSNGTTTITESLTIPTAECKRILEELKPAPAH